MIELKLYVGTSGVKLVVETGMDLSTVSTAKLRVRKPRGQVIEWAGTPVGTTIEYYLQSGDLDEAGRYMIQAHITQPDGSELFGQTDILVVYELFE